MLRQFTLGVLALAVLVTTSLWSFGGQVPADAAVLTQKCALIKYSKVGGVDWWTLRTTRICDTSSPGGVSGKAYPAQNRIIVKYNERTSSTLQVQKTTVHEMTHIVEWKTTPAMRVKLYALLGIRTNGNYYSIPTVPGSNLAAWKRSARERLAESTVKCLFGAGSFSGMVLVPTYKCKTFILTLRQAIAAAR